MGDYKDLPPEELPFHYNREERLNIASDGVRNNLYSGEKRKKIIFDRRLLIIMVDIVIVVIAFIGISAYQGSKARVSNFEGVRMELLAVAYDGEILASLKAETLKNPDPGSLIEASFFIEEGVEITLVDLIPSQKGDRRILRAVLEPSEQSQILKARIVIGDKSVDMEKRITGE